MVYNGGLGDHEIYLSFLKVISLLFFGQYY